MRVEYRFLLLGCLVRRTEEEQKELATLFGGTIDWERVGGQLLRHRLGGYFYVGLGGLRAKLGREIRVALKLLTAAQKQQVQKSEELLSLILLELEKRSILYALVKGHLFSRTVYPLGIRRSNDSDLLVRERDLDVVEQVLRDLGYVQSFCIEGSLAPATRRDIIIQRLNHHDTVPFGKMVDSEFIDLHEVDLNFHFDSKSNDITEAIFQNHVVRYEGSVQSATGLDWSAGLAQLCIHYFREATSSIWTAVGRDLTLYKIVDIANWVRSKAQQVTVEEFCEFVHTMGILHPVYFTLHTLIEFLPDEFTIACESALRPDDLGWISDIYQVETRTLIKRELKISESAFNLVAVTK